jgi:hypothetical protein
MPKAEIVSIKKQTEKQAEKQAEQQTEKLRRRRSDQTRAIPPAPQLGM